MNAMNIDYENEMHKTHNKGFNCFKRTTANYLGMINKQIIPNP